MFGPYRMRRRGLANLPSRGALLVVSNHISYLDPPALGLAAGRRRPYFMAKSELFRPPPAGWLLRAIGGFPVVRGGADRDAIRHARGLLGEGRCIVMFPEGTRSPDGVLGQPFPGAGSLALEPGVTVVPAALWGTRRLFGPVRLVFGPPLDLSGLGGGSKGSRAQEATRRMMAAIGDLVELAGGPPQGPP